MKVILSAEVSNLGSSGDIVTVKDGYARNFLLPRGMASLANESNKKALAHQLRILEKRRAKVLEEAKKLASSIEKTSVTVTKQVGEDEKIFGSVTTQELHDLLIAEGIEVDKKAIKLAEEIKKVGVYQAEVKLHAQVTAIFKVWVVAQSA